MERGGPSSKTRDRLVDGAARTVGKHGVHGLTVQQVIGAAKLSRRTFYLYFRDKDDVLLALYRRVVADLIARIEGAVEATSDPLERLYAGVDAYLDFQARGGRLVTLLQAAAVDPSSNLWRVREDTLDRLVDLLDTEVQRQLDVRLDPLVYRTLYLGLEGLVLHMREGGPLAPDARQLAGDIVRPLFVAVLAAAPHLAQRRT